MSKQIGFKAEEMAREYLQQQGLVWRGSNYQSRIGEIDLIMQDGVYLVFVEVRSRRSNAFGHPIETVTWQKQQKIIKTAAVYLSAHGLHDKYPLRFDVISIQGRSPQIDWVKNAFGS